jgi:hypothetical protein
MCSIAIKKENNLEGLPSQRINKMPVLLVHHDGVQIHIVQDNAGKGSHPPRVHRHKFVNILRHQLSKQTPII